MPSKLLLAVIAAFLPGACGGMGERTDEPCAGMACRPTETVSWTAVGGRRPLDLVIVLDDRVPTGAASTAFAKAMLDLATNLQQEMHMDRFAGDIHIAMVPANLDPAAGVSRLWPQNPICPLPTGAFVQTSELCDTPTNFAGSLPDLLLCAASNLPLSGLPSRPVDTLGILLSSGGLAETTGFRRPEAALLLAIVTAEDDPSIATPEQQEAFSDFLMSLLAEDTWFDVAVVAPLEADGLVSFLYQLSRRRTDDLAAASWPSFSFLGQGASSRTVMPCLGNPFSNGDTVPESPYCSFVERVLGPSGEILSEQPLPECLAQEAPAAPCWRAGLDRARCPGSGIYLKYVAPPLACRSADLIRCIGTCATPYLPANPLEPSPDPP